MNVLGRYQVERQLGAGAFGRTFLALDGARPVALKVLSSNALRHTVLAEADALRAVSSEHIARVHEVLLLDTNLGPPLHASKDDAVIIQEFVAGKRADKYVARLHPSGREASIARIGLSVALALHATHERGLVHGDVSPANVLVADESCHLIDFGLVSPPGRYPAATGTPGYMAPERWRGVRAFEGDLFSLGLTLLSLVRGAPAAPKSISSPREYLEWSMSLGEPHLPPQTAPRLRAVIMRLLAQAESSRGTAHDVVRELSNMVPGTAPPELLVAPSLRSSQVSRLPLVGRRDERSRLSALLRDQALLVVSGRPGVGKTRLIEESVSDLQREAVANGSDVPSYYAPGSAIPSIMSGTSIVHIDARMPEAAAALASLRNERRASGADIRLVVEQSEPTEEGLALRPLSEAHYQELFAASAGLSEDIVTALHRATSGCVGAAIRRVAAHVSQTSAPLDASSLVAVKDGAQEPASEGARQALRRLAWLGGEAPPQLVAPSAEVRSELRAGGWVSVTASGMFTSIGRWSGEEEPSLSPGSEGLPERCRAFVALHRGEESAARQLEVLAAERKAEGDLIEVLRLTEPAVDGRLAADRGEALRLVRADALRARCEYERALRTLADSETPQALSVRAELFRLERRTDEARAIVGQGRMLMAVRARALFDVGRFAEADAEAHQALSGASDPATRARLVETRALAALYGGDASEAERLLDKELQTQPRSSRERARLLSVLGSVLQRLGRFDDSLRRFQEAVSGAEAVGELHAVATYLASIGALHIDRGDLGLALPVLREAVSRLARLGRTVQVARALLNLGSGLHLVGEDSEAHAVVGRAQELAREVGDMEAVAMAHVQHADIALRRGEVRVARTALREASTSKGAGRASSFASARLVQLFASLGDVALARESLDGMEAWAPGSETERALAEARTLSAEGDHTSAIERLELAAERAMSESMETHLRYMLSLGELHARHGEQQRAGVAFEAARALLDRARRGLNAREGASLGAVPEYARALAARPGEVDPMSAQTWRRVAEVAVRLAEERVPRRILREVMRAALDLLGGDLAAVVERQSGGLSVRFSTQATSIARVSQSVIDRAIVRNEPVSSADALSDSRLASASSVHLLALRSVVAVPIRLREDKSGALYLQDAQRPAVYGGEELEVLQALVRIAEGSLRAGEMALRLRDAEQASSAPSAMQSKSERTSHAPELEWVAESPAMARAVSVAQRASTTSASVLVSGPSGVGKGRLAKFIHAESDRSAGPYLAIRCASSNDELLASEFFGHTRGAFTDAVNDRPGVFELADGGSLLLDEVSELSVSMQSRLLRVLQEREVRRMGAASPVSFDVRVIATTQRDLKKEVQAGRFREDLYFRLAVLSVEVPSLADRAADLAGLATYFVRMHAPGVALHTSGLRVLRGRHFEGNVRELENVIRRGLLLADEELRAEHLGESSRHATQEVLDLRTRVDELERELVREALRKTEGNRTKAAKLLGLSRHGLLKKSRRLGLD